MAIEIEGRIALPKRSACRFNGALTKAAEDQETLANDLLEPLERNLFAKQQDAANHHQIRRTIHPQPSGIDRRETFAVGLSHRVRVNSAGARLKLRASYVSSSSSPKRR